MAEKNKRKVSGHVLPEEKYERYYKKITEHSQGGCQHKFPDEFFLIFLLLAGQKMKEEATAKKKDKYAEPQVQVSPMGKFLRNQVNHSRDDRGEWNEFFQVAQ